MPSEAEARTGPENGIEASQKSTAQPNPAPGSVLSGLLEVAAHDLRNPLSGLLAATQYLIEDGGPLLRPEHVDILRSMESSVQSMLGLLEDFVEITKADSRELTLRMHATDVGLLVEHVVAVNRTLAENKRIKVEVTGAQRLPAIAADAIRLGRAVELLLSNAIRSSRAGQQIGLALSSEPDHVVLTVVATEARTPGTLFRHAVDSFRGDASSSQISNRRLSLILDYVKRVVEAHRGNLRMESGEKTGFRVMLALPVLTRTKDFARAKPKGQNGKILRFN